jgi:Pup amidohydrolase
MGMETEYALVVADRQNLSPEDLPPAGLVYEQIVQAIRRTQPAASGIYDRDQWFLASGPAVTLETHPSLWNLPGGLIEIATPEVHTATELLECQTAIDRLVAEAASNSETGFDLRVLKNSSDALGHVYGCQENYQCEVARGWTLLIYRMAMMFLMGMQLISQLLSLPFLAVIVTIGTWQNRRRKNAELDSDDPWQQDQGNLHSSALPPTYIRIMSTALRMLHYPMVFGLRQVCKRVAFRRHQKFLTAHLISRIVLSGGGHLETDGRYVLSPKSMVTDSIADMGGFDGERPIYVFGHWLSLLCARSFFHLGSCSSC